MASDDDTGVNVKAIVVVLLGLSAAGGLAYVLTQDGIAPRDSAVVSEDPDPSASDGTEDVAAADDVASEPRDTVADAPSTPDPPRFDQIRVAPDGATVIAGQAPPGFTLTLRLDGEEVATAQSGPSGEFATILSLSPSSEPRLLSILATAEDGTEVPGGETAIIAPFGIATEDALAPDVSLETADADMSTGDEPLAETEPDPENLEIAALDPGPDPVTEPEPVPEPVPEPAPEPDVASTPSRADRIEPDSGTDTTEAPVPTVSDTTSDEATPPAADASEAEDDAGGLPRETQGDTVPDPGSTEDTAGTAAITDEQGVTRDDAEAPAVVDADPEATTEPDAPVPGDADDADATVATVNDAASDPGTGETTASDTTEAAPAIVVASPEGVRVVQSGTDAPEAQTEVQIDAITYTTLGDVAISGRGPADRQVQILLNNRVIQLGEIGPGGAWSLELPDVDPGTYTLSVTQLSPEGEVESRVDTPFLREDPARVAGSPMRVQDGVSVITVQPGFTLWGIAEANFGDGIAYVQIFQENRDSIRDPDLIFPGQIFQLPDLPRDAERE